MYTINILGSFISLINFSQYSTFWALGGELPHFDGQDGHLGWSIIAK
jgi:hypothetical protein